ncbi:MAG: hypothetical protein ACMXX8_03920 [Candidatus Woesearchaeota archaeon]
MKIINKKLYFFSIILISLLIYGCGDVYIEKQVFSDGSAIYKQTYDFESFFKQMEEEDPEEYKDFMEEDYFSEESEMCKNAIDDKRWDEEYLYFGCEQDKFKTNFYAYLNKETIPITKEKGLYEYEVKSFLEYFDLSPEYAHDDEFKGKMFFTLYFEGEVISSDIGLVEGNKVTFNIFDISQSFNNYENPKIIAKVKNKKTKFDKKPYTVKFNFDGSYDGSSSYYSFENFNEAKLIWNLTESEIEKLICKQIFNHGYFRPDENLRDINCILKNNEIILISEFDKGNLGTIINNDGNFEFNIKNLFFLREVSIEDFTKEINFYKNHGVIIEDEIELHYIFEGIVLSTDVGIKDKNKVIIKYADLNGVEEDSKIIVSSEKIVKQNHNIYLIVLSIIILVGIFLLFLKIRSKNNKNLVNPQNQINTSSFNNQNQRDFLDRYKPK